MSDQHQPPIQLWVSEHNNGWEAWVAQLGDGTFTAWACPTKENAVATYLEDTFERACAAAHFDLVRLTGHEECGPGCGSWQESGNPTAR